MCSSGVPNQDLAKKWTHHDLAIFKLSIILILCIGNCLLAMTSVITTGSRLGFLPSICTVSAFFERKMLLLNFVKGEMYQGTIESWLFIACVIILS